MTCADGSDDEVALFNLKAKEQGINSFCQKILWKDLPKHFLPKSFDFIFCRGNSFIYAGGGWNSMVEIDKNKAMDDYRETLNIFYDLLKDGGWLYLDKFKDSEASHEEKVCQIKVNNGELEDLIFWRERYPEKKLRQADLIRRIGNKEIRTPNITYDLSFGELEGLVGKVGFSKIEKVSFPSEDHFDILLAQK